MERDQRQPSNHLLGRPHGKEEAGKRPLRESQLDLLRTELRPHLPAASFAGVRPRHALAGTDVWRHRDPHCIRVSGDHYLLQSSLQLPQGHQGNPLHRAVYWSHSDDWRLRRDFLFVQHRFRTKWRHNVMVCPKGRRL